MKHRVDVLNFCLIWISLGLALAWPFELFLFSYIILGPLHYLTEINWLDKQNYFLRPPDRKFFIGAMIVIVALLAVCTFLPEFDQWRLTRPIHDAVYGGGAGGAAVARALRGGYLLVLVAFVMSTAWVLTDRWIWRSVVMLFCLLSCFVFYRMPTMAILLGVLVPTIVHVFFFTILFMLFGSVKARSAWGYVNVACMFLALAVIVFWQPATELHLSRPVIELTILSEFDKVNLAINRLLGFVGSGPVNPNAPAFLKMQSFIAFAYTYHYLNWFSKTSIIRWHQVSKTKLGFSVALWASSVGLFAVDYRLGFAASFALSALHIFLEFPLNYVSVDGMARALVGKVKSGGTSAGPGAAVRKRHASSAAGGAVRRADLVES
ncbi:MAG TPA: hypothetical protein VHH88_12615 [Verrucomicrobiae bacterium]|nr:hypothetical protein [Verrucomicrobiae bacterium]